VPDAGGLLMNLTACDSGDAGLAWAFDAATSQLSNVAAAGGGCVTVLACDNTPGAEVFAYACVTNACSNEKWTLNGTAVVSQVAGAAQPLCLTGVDPATGPSTQLVVDVCDGRAAQAWAWDAPTGTLRLPSLPAASQCLTLLAPPALDAYMKTMDDGDVALALLNRGAAAAPPQTVDLTGFGYAPAQAVYVRDVWAAATLGPFSGSFTTRAVESHETLLLRLSLTRPAHGDEL
jgi:hypothetical protein